MGNSVEELDFFASTLKSVRNKKYELFVVSRILHLLNDREIEFTTQQIVKTRNKKRYFLDLYFPQLKLAIEIDESYHNSLAQISKDKERDKAIVLAADIEIVRIKVSGLGIGDVNKEIDGLINFILLKKKELIDLGNFKPYVHGEKYNTCHWLEVQKLDVSSDARFRTHVEVARLFGKNYAGHQRAQIHLDESFSVWFPKLYDNGDWSNSISDDGKTIKMQKIAGGRYSSVIQKEGNRFVFAHYKDEFGAVYYAFKGVFIVKKWQKNLAEFERVCDAFEFDGLGQFKILT